MRAAVARGCSLSGSRLRCGVVWRTGPHALCGVQPGSALANTWMRSAAPARQLSSGAAPLEQEGVREDVRNVAIVAHVDHGKTTLVDAMLQSTKGEQVGKDDRVMDHNDQERERGITILAKNAAIEYEGLKVNILDTPGHADFGGEVERVLNMVDGVLLVVDAAEGPKPQTRFVLRKALALGHKILVVVNKIDKPSARPDWVIDHTFDLFCELGASDEQTDFPVVYTSALNRIAGVDPAEMTQGMKPLLDAIAAMPKPPCDLEAPLQLQVANVASDPFVGRLGIGRLRSGTLRRGASVGLSAGPGEAVRNAKVSEVFLFDGMSRCAVDEATAGDIVAFAGISEFSIGDTLVDESDPMPLPPIAVEQPTMSITMGVNKSPVGGKVGTKLTSSKIRERLDHELQTNVAMEVRDTKDGETVEVFGRGLLHLTVLIESMRREGFELMLGCPQVIEKVIDGVRSEPFETVDIELPESTLGGVADLFLQRKATLLEMGEANGEGLTSVVYELPSRCLVGVKSRLMTATQGNAVMTSTFAGYKPYAGEYGARTRGNMLSTSQGPVTAYALDKVGARGRFFSGVADVVYENQIVGISAREGDVKVNICKGKELTNMRASGKDDMVKLAPPMQLTLEDAVEYIASDEYVEVTPEAIRMGKRVQPNTRGVKKGS